MDKVKHEIEAALALLEEGNIERAKLHLVFALQWRNDEASQQTLAPDTSPVTVARVCEHGYKMSCPHGCL